MSKICIQSVVLFVIWAEDLYWPVTFTLLHCCPLLTLLTVPILWPAAAGPLWLQKETQESHNPRVSQLSHPRGWQRETTSSLYAKLSRLRPDSPLNANPHIQIPWHRDNWTPKSWRIRANLLHFVLYQRVNTSLSTFVLLLLVLEHFLFQYNIIEMHTYQYCTYYYQFMGLCTLHNLQMLNFCTNWWMKAKHEQMKVK